MYVAFSGIVLFHTPLMHVMVSPYDDMLPVCAGVLTPYFSQGCYKDFFGGLRMLPLLRSPSGINGIGVNSSCMNVELCGYIAQTQGFAYFGVEAGTCACREEERGINTTLLWILQFVNPFFPGCHFTLLCPSLRVVCFAGDDGHLATSQGQSSSCSSPCVNAPSKTCGGWEG